MQVFSLKCICHGYKMETIYMLIKKESVTIIWLYSEYRLTIKNCMKGI